MMQYNNFRRTTSPWRANAMTLVALVSITFWSAQQRPNTAPQFSQSSASASSQVHPTTVASTANTASITTGSLSSTALEPSGLHQISYNPAWHHAFAVKR